MGARSGSNYLTALKKLRAEIWLGGERVAEVNSHPALRECARSIASLYDMQMERVEQMTYRTDDGGRSGLSFIQPKSIDELRRRSRMMAAWANFSGGMMLQTPDLVNVALAAMASARDFFAASDSRYGDNIANYYLEARKHDWCATLTTIGPGTRFEQAGDGIIVHGTGASTPLAPFAEELLVLPTSPMHPDTPAIAFAIPCNTQGVRFVFRDDDAARVTAPRSHFDAPLASRFDVADCPVIFDEVVVPWQRVFICGDRARCDTLLDETGARVHMLHQTAAKNLAKAEFILGLAARIGAIEDKMNAPHIRTRLSDMVSAVERIRVCLHDAEVEAAPNQSGITTPARVPLEAARGLLIQPLSVLMQLVQLIGWDLSSPPPRPAEASARERASLQRLAWDALVSPFAKNQFELERGNHLDRLYAKSDSLDLGDLAPLVERIKDFIVRND